MTLRIAAIIAPMLGRRPTGDTAPAPGPCIEPGAYHGRAPECVNRGKRCPNFGPCSRSVRVYGEFADLRCNGLWSRAKPTDNGLSYGELGRRVKTYLAGHGPSTAFEIADALGYDLALIKEKVYRLAARGYILTVGKQRVDANHTRAIYALKEEE